MSFFDGIEDAMDKKAEELEEQRSAEKWDPEPGEVLQGILLRADTPITQYGESLVLTVRNVGKKSGGVAKNKTAAVWAGTVLRGLLEDFEAGQPKVGKALAIRYEGMKDTKDGSNQYKSFTLMVEEQDHAYWQKVLYSGPQMDVREAVKQRQDDEPEGGWF
jgi:hypothetical protein